MYRTKSTLKSYWLYKSVHNTSFNIFLIASNTCIHRSARMHAAHTHLHACTHAHGCMLPGSAFFSLWNCFYLNNFCCVPVMLSWYNCTFCCCFSLAGSPKLECRRKANCPFRFLLFSVQLCCLTQTTLYCEVQMGGVGSPVSVHCGFPSVSALWLPQCQCTVPVGGMINFISAETDVCCTDLLK